MSFFTNIVTNIKEFYQEINAATLTGAIDVIVVESEDGSLRSSPFHVRFGKLGVLKAREKIVDLEVNGEQVSIQMKLDDNGAAFFVEEVEEDEWSPDLATSPIPSSSQWEFKETPRTNPLEGARLSEDPLLTSIKLSEALTDTGDDEKEEGRKGKLNKKKRRRRSQLKQHARKGSKTSLKEIIPESDQDMFLMDDVNDADQEEGEAKDQNLEEWREVKEKWTPTTKRLMARNLSLEFSDDFPPGQSTPNSAASAVGGGGGLTAGSTPASEEEDPLLGSSAPHIYSQALDDKAIEKSLIGCRVPIIPKSSSEAEALEALLTGGQIPGLVINDDIRPKSVSAGFHYFSDNDADGPSTPIGNGRDSPVTSDSEIEKGARDDQTSWRWGELPNTPSVPINHQSLVFQAGCEDEEKKKEQEKSSLLGWFRTSEKEGRETEKGMYLDDLISGQVDPATAAIYLQPGHLHSHENSQSPDFSQPSAAAQLFAPAADVSKNDPLDLSGVSSGSILPDDNTSGFGPHERTDDDIAESPGHNFQTAAQPFRIKEEPRDLEDENVLDKAGQVEEEDCESGHGPSLPMSPQSGIINPHHVIRSRNFNSDSEDDIGGAISRHFPDFALSLCGLGAGAKEDSAAITPDMFNEKLLDHKEFVKRLRENRDLLADERLVVRLNDKYVSWTAAAPVILSVALFKEPLPADLSSDLTSDGLAVNLSLAPVKTEAVDSAAASQLTSSNTTAGKKSGWFTWFGSGSTNTTPSKADKFPEIKEEIVADVKKEEEEVGTTTLEQLDRRDSSLKTKDRQNSSSDEGDIDPRRLKKTLRLTSTKLAELGLKPGVNEVQFSVTTAFQGTTRCKCHIYLWKETDKVVISDIDGTITKSDVLGHILPVIGRDWAQSGVADLFTKIRANGYQIMYLSARAIGQASITKDYLHSVKQGDVCLPDGPIFLNPESLIHAFRKEVIDRCPEEFKIRCLKDIQSLFGGRNPFFAGYGNRPNDAYAYRAVGIPVSRIFTINPAGELRHELTQNFQTSYVSQCEIVDMFFPPDGKDGFHPDQKIQEFSDFGFWRDSIPDVDTPTFEEMAQPP